MDEKLRILMQSENLTASKLAEILEVKPAAISHILSGRNKPSFELLCKLINRFPQINPYWLLGNATDMRNTNAPISTSQIESSAIPNAIAATPGTLFDQSNETSLSGEKYDIDATAINVPISTSGRSNIEKILIIYRDQTFEEIRPKR
jgi:transcriptional regulator with XRE-family HTH domain